MKSPTKNLNIAFFGSPPLGVFILDELERHDIVPNLIITMPDRPAGRKLLITPPPEKVWAEERAISTFQPEILDDNAYETIVQEGPWDLFIVAAYGKIIPKRFLDIPKHDSLNIHPSLLPKFRGASPIKSAILEADETGVTIILMDEKMDHGPIVAQEKIEGNPKDFASSELEQILSIRGAILLADMLPKWINGEITPTEQDHTKATFTKKFVKEDGQIDLADDPEKNFRKIQAFNIWPRTYFFVERNGIKTRVIITEATLENGKLVIKKVIPEGKKEMEYKHLTSNM